MRGCKFVFFILFLLGLGLLFNYSVLAASPSNGTVSPSSGCITSSETVIRFTTTHSDPDGYTDLNEIRFLINNRVDGRATGDPESPDGSFYGYADLNNGHFYIRNAQDTEWIDLGVRGSLIDRSNGYVTLKNTSDISFSANTVTAYWDLVFQNTWQTENNNLYLYTSDDAGAYADWGDKGDYYIDNSLATPGKPTEFLSCKQDGSGNVEWRWNIPENPGCGTINNYWLQSWDNTGYWYVDQWLGNKTSYIVYNVPFGRTIYAKLKAQETTGNQSQWSETGFLPIACNVSPVIDSVTISHPYVRPNGVRQYTITVKGSDINGSDDVADLRAMINLQGDDHGKFRGYLIWRYDEWWKGNVDWTSIVSCSGGGYAAKHKPFGARYLNLISCSTSTSGNQRAANFVVSFNPDFQDPTIGNDISGIVFDRQWWSSGWENFPDLFDLLLNATISGEVWVDVDGDGWRDASEIGTNQATLIVRRQADGWSASVPLNADGTFTTPLLELDHNYHLEINFGCSQQTKWNDGISIYNYGGVSRPFYTAIGSNDYPLALVDVPNVTSSLGLKIIGTSGEGIIQGNVFNDLDKDGEFDAGESLMANLKINHTSEFSNGASLTTSVSPNLNISGCASNEGTIFVVNITPPSNCTTTYAICGAGNKMPGALSCAVSVQSGQTVEVSFGLTDNPEAWLQTINGDIYSAYVGESYALFVNIPDVTEGFEPYCISDDSVGADDKRGGVITALKEINCSQAGVDAASERDFRLVNYNHDLDWPAVFNTILSSQGNIVYESNSIIINDSNLDFYQGKIVIVRGNIYISADIISTPGMPDPKILNGILVARGTTPSAGNIFVEDAAGNGVLHVKGALIAQNAIYIDRSLEDNQYPAVVIEFDSGLLFQDQSSAPGLANSVLTWQEVVPEEF